MKLAFGMISLLILNYGLFAAPADQSSSTKFNTAEAQQAQAQYNQAAQAAWTEYMKQVMAAQEQYVKALQPLKAQVAARENFQEASAIKAEIDRYTVDLKNGLVLHMNFENVAGTKVPDISPLGNHGVLLGGTMAPGKFGKALQCKYDNKTDGVRIKDHPSLDMKEVTVCAWIKTDRLDENWNRILDKDWQTAYNLSLGGDFENKNFRNKLVFEVSYGGIQSVSPVVDGQWHFVAGVFGEGFYKLYIDGNLDLSKKRDNKNPIQPNDRDVIIGNNGGDYNPPEANYFDGLIDEVRLYNRPLSDREIMALYQSQP